MVPVYLRESAENNAIARNARRDFASDETIEIFLRLENTSLIVAACEVVESWL